MNAPMTASMSTTKNSRSRAGRQRGVAIVEFALALPFMLMLTFVVTEYSRALYQYNTLAKSVRDAARYLSVQNPGTKIAQAKNLVVYGNPAGTGSPLAMGLTTSLVPDPVWQLAGAAPVINTVTIGITGYTFTPMMATAFGLTFGTLNFAPITATMRCPL
jgi:hypothetical protein